MKTGCLFDFRNPPQWAQPYADLYNDTIDDMVLPLKNSALIPRGRRSTTFLRTAISPPSSPSSQRWLPEHSASVSAPSSYSYPLHDPVRRCRRRSKSSISFHVDALILGLGQGYRVGEFTGFEKDHKRRGSALTEGASTFSASRGLENAFSHAGKFWNYTDIMVTPSPAQPGGPPLMVGARSEKGIQRVARMGFVIFCPLVITEDVDIYRTACTDLGREPWPGPHPAFVLCLTDKDDSELDKVWPHVNYQVDHYAKWMHEANDKPEDRTNTSDGFRDLSNFFTPPTTKGAR